MKLQILLFLSVLALSKSYKSYEGYQVFRTAPLLPDSITGLQVLQRSSHVDFWFTPRVDAPLVVMVSSEHATSLKSILTELELEPKLLIPNMAPLIDNERNEILRLRQSGGRAPAFDRFLTFEEIQAYLDEVVTTYPSIASIINIGTSYEGRPLRVLKISGGPGRPGIFIDAAIHAREWAGPPVTLYAINELTENLANNQQILNMADFYFLPVANPDGYSYTWSTERLWRKTRSPNNGSACIGTDLNRNFDWQWQAGGPVDPCDNTYAGSSAFSENEAAAMANFIARNPTIGFYFGIHSFGSTLLFPWGGTTELAPNHDEHLAIGLEAADAIRAVRGTNYTPQPISAGTALIYSTSVDWSYGAGGALLSFSIELPGGGDSGFELPPSEILPVATETWEGIKVFAANTQMPPQMRTDAQ